MVSTCPTRSERFVSYRLRALSVLLMPLALLLAACSGGGGGGGGGESAGGGTTTLNYGKQGDPVHLVVGYQPYYTESWSGAIIRGKEMWKKYLPPGSTVEFQTGLQGAIIVNAMLAGKQQIGYMGDMPAIVATTKRNVADIRMVSVLGMSHDQCNIFFARNDAPQFPDQQAALKWLNGKSVAVPKGSCTDRFAQSVFQDLNIKPASYLNQSIEVITSGFRVGKLDGAVIWEPTASRLIEEKLARRVASGNAVGEWDAGFLDMRADLIKQRPDVVKAWLNAEIDAEKFMQDPKNAKEVASILKSQTTGFTEKTLWTSLYGTYPPSEGGSNVRLVQPFVFDQNANSLIKKATAFLYKIKSINVQELPKDAVQQDFAQQVLKARNMNSPLGEIHALPETAYATR
jgi:NitT/TauT family transport system substrate-binding protein